MPFCSASNSEGHWACCSLNVQLSSTSRTWLCESTGSCQGSPLGLLCLLTKEGLSLSSPLCSDDDRARGLSRHWSSLDWGEHPVSMTQAAHQNLLVRTVDSVAPVQRSRGAVSAAALQIPRLETFPCFRVSVPVVWQNSDTNPAHILLSQSPDSSG